MFGKFKRNKGITLISIIITIIIMLILATISINFILGDSGLFKKAKAAIDIHKKAAVQEEL